MYVGGCLHRCQPSASNIPSHTTYNSGVIRTESKHARSIEEGTLRQILMVDYWQLKLVVMKVGWVPRFVEGHSTIKRNRHGFWTCKLDLVENSKRRNHMCTLVRCHQYFS